MTAQELNAYLKALRREKNRPSVAVRAVICADGLVLSVQATSNHYCTPQADGLDEYSSVEVAPCRGTFDAALLPFKDARDGQKPEHAAYAYVPVEVVADIINRHGGIRPVRARRKRRREAQNVRQ